MIISNIYLSFIMCLNTSEVFNILQNISIVIASIVAIYGINSWRREAKWKRKFELAEETLSLFYEVRDRLDYIRNPFSNPEEGKTRKRNENESAEDAKIFDMAYVVYERYEYDKSSFLKLKTIKYRFVAVFGIKYIEPFNDVNKIVNSIFSAAQILARNYWRNQGTIPMTKEQSKIHLEALKKYESIFWSDFSDKDEIKIQMNEAIEKMEKICSKILKK